MDVELRLQQRQANLHEWLWTVRQLDADEVDFGERKVGELQDFASAVGVVDHNADESAIDRVGDAQCHDPNIVAFETPEQVVQPSHAIFQEHGELPQRRPLPAARGHGFGGLPAPRSLLPAIGRTPSRFLRTHPLPPDSRFRPVGTLRSIPARRNNSLC